MSSLTEYVMWYLQVSSLKLIAMMYASLLALEIVAGRKDRMPVRKVVRNCIYLLTMLPIVVVLRPAVTALVNDITAIFGGPLLDLTFEAGGTLWGQVAASFTVAFIYDAFYYWHHRLQHRSLAAWATHRLHHLDENMGVTTGYKHHWTDEALRTLTVFLPMGLLFKLEPVTLFWVSFLFAFHQLALHVNIKCSFGPLDYIFMSPDLHRVHHSQLKEHFGKNLGATFSLFDIAFGTFHPAPKHAPPTGIPNVPEMNLFEEHFHPFRDWAAMLKAKIGTRISPRRIRRPASRDKPMTEETTLNADPQP